MKNERQLNLITLSLTKDKDKFLVELNKVTNMLDNKISSLAKIKTYYDDCHHQDRLKMTKQVPILTKNFSSFGKKIMDLIKSEEVEIARLAKVKKGLVEKVSQLDQKIKFIKSAIEKIGREKQFMMDKREQLAIDDLAVNKLVREEYE